MGTKPTPEEIRRLIDEALEEIDRTEAGVIALVEELGGPDAAQRLLAYRDQQSSSPRTAALRKATAPAEPGSLRPGASPAPSREPPATR